jgi:mRNA interferase MazF
VVIIQTDLLNETHLSTIICPITTNVKKEIELLRVHLKAGQLDNISDILVDQIRAIDNKRLIKKLGQLNKDQKIRLKSNLRIVLDI